MAGFGILGVSRLEGSASQSRVGAQSTATEHGHLEHPAGNGDILEEVDKLVLIAQVVVEDQCRLDGENAQCTCGQSSFEAEDEHCGKAELYQQCHDVA